MQARLAVRASREVVAEQAARGVRGCIGGRLVVERAALDEEHIEIAIVVVVEERDPGAHFLGHVVLAGCAVDMGEVQTRCGGRFDKYFVASAFRWKLDCAL